MNARQYNNYIGEGRAGAGGGAAGGGEGSRGACFFSLSDQYILFFSFCGLTF